MALTERLNMLITASGAQASREFEEVGASARVGLGSAETSAGRMGAGLAVVGIAAAVAAVGIAKLGIDAAHTFESYGLQVSKLERLTGESAKGASELAFAFQQTGVDADAGGKALGIFSKKLVASTDPMHDFGIQTRDAHGFLLPMQDILAKTADKFAAMPDGPEKAALAMKEFGKGGTALIPFLDKGSAGLEQLNQKAKEFGLVLSQDDVNAARAAVGAQRDFSASLKGLEIQLGRSVLPLLTDLSKMATQAAVSIHGLSSGFADQRSDVFIAQTAKGFDHLTDALGRTEAEHKKYQDAVKHDLNPSELLADKAVEDSLEQVATKARTTIGIINSLAASTHTSKDAITEWINSQAQAGITFDNSKDALAAYTANVNGQESAEQKAAAATDQNTDAIKNQHDALLAQLDPYFAVNQAQKDLADSQQAVLTAIAEHGIKSREAQQATIDQAGAAEKLTAEQLNLKDSLDKGDTSLGQMNYDLNAMVAQGKITQGQANAVADAFGAIQNKADGVVQGSPYKTTVVADTTQFWGAMQAITQELNALTGSVDTISIGVGGVKFHAAGGMLDEGWNVVGEQGPEAIYKSGGKAKVMTAGQTKKMMGGGGGVTIHVSAPHVVDRAGLAHFIKTQVAPELRRHERSMK